MNEATCEHEVRVETQRERKIILAKLDEILKLLKEGKEERGDSASQMSIAPPE
jgi:hypothetical protein